MDIHRWLENTADRAPPDRNSEDLHIPDFLRPNRVETDRIGRNYRHKRKRASSDSSIIAPRPGHRANLKTVRSPSPDHLRKAGSNSSSSSRSSHSAEDRLPAKTYERRPRHKTRPDRYEPKSKKRRKERDAPKASKSRQKRRKSHRSGDGGRTTGLVQSFQLKNGPKNNRLTLKPEAVGGIFKHGRASVQMAGRGGGLPDLVFNEMRFLQNPNEHQDEDREVEESRKPNAKERKRNHEEEISAYFKAKNPEDGRDDPAAHKQQKHDEKQHQDQIHNAGPPRNRPKTPIVDLPEKPFLGFGSKGAQPESKDTHGKETSYYTWSESVPHPSSPPHARPLAAPVGEVGELSTKRPISEARRRTKVHEESHPIRQAGHQPAKNNSAGGEGQWIETRRSRGPARVEVYQPPNALKPPARYHDTSVTRTTAQSLPRHHSSDANGREIRRDEAAPNHEAHDSYNTSDILRIRKPPERSKQIPALQYQHVRERDKENEAPESSFSIDRALRYARDAIAKPVPVWRSPPQDGKDALRELGHTTNLGPVYAESRTRQVHHPLPAYHRSAKQPHLGSRHSIRDHWHPETTYQSPGEAGPRSLTTRPSRPTKAKHLLPAHVQQPMTILEDDDEMLDNSVGGALRDFVDEYIYANSRQVEDLVFRSTSIPRSSIFEPQAERLERGLLADSPMTGHRSIGGTPARGLSIENSIHSERIGESRRDEVDADFVGFWKPHKLY